MNYWQVCFRSLLPTLLAWMVFPVMLDAQCHVGILVDTNNYNTIELCTGDSITVHAEGECIVFSDNFDNYAWSTQWAYFPPLTSFSNPCSGSPNGTAYAWFGDLIAPQREAVTKDLNLTPGGYIRFDLKYGQQGNGTPCDGPDEMREGVSLQYSTDGGDFWFDIAYFAPTGVILPTNPMTLLPATFGATVFSNWATYTFPVPPAAMTAATRFRWTQFYANYYNGHYDDSWGLDNIIISRSIHQDVVWNFGDTTLTPPGMQPLQDSLLIIHLLDYAFPYDTVLSDTLNVIVHPIPAFEFVLDTTTICFGDTLEIGVTGSYDYIWSNGTHGNKSVVVPGENTTYSVTSTDNIGCVHIDSMTVFVEPLPLLVVTNDTICVGQTATLQATGGVSYQWSNGGDQAAIQVSPTSSMVYSVTATGANNCSISAQSSLFVWPLPQAITTADTTICLGGLATLVAGGGVAYQWSNGANLFKIEADPLKDTWYFVTVTDVHGCQQLDSVLVRVNPFSSFSLFSDTDTMCRGTSATLTVEGGHHYSWSTGENTPAITVFPGKSTNYAVTVSEDYYGTRCFLSEEIRVYVRECNTFHIANAFNPQGYTTIFKPVGEYVSITDYFFAIYDRWGRLIYQTTDPYDGWDGRINGEYAPNAVYVYHVRFTKEYLNETFEKIGTVTVIR